jgi:hypothetical protein
MSMTLHLEFLRNEYADAHRRFAKSKAELEALELRLEATGIPKWEWRKQVLQCLIKLKREWERDLKNVLRLGRELKAFEVPAAAKAEIQPPVQPEKVYPITYIQRVEVKIVDGKTETRITPDAAHWIKVSAWHVPRCFKRVYHFPDKQIPPEYAYLLQHNGFRYAPTDLVYIEYEPVEFQRICEREVEAQGAHALDGERLRYGRRNDKEPFGKVVEEEKEVSDEEEKSEENSPSGSVD